MKHTPLLVHLRPTLRPDANVPTVFFLWIIFLLKHVLLETQENISLVTNFALRGGLKSLWNNFTSIL